MSLAISITVKGDKEILKKLKSLGDSINDHKEAMREIGKEAAKYYSTIGFSDKGRPWGEPWPDYSPAYRRYKEKKYGYSGKPNLIATGTMKDSFYARETANSVTIGNSSPFYKYHQSTAARKKIPRRPMAGINGSIKRMVKDILREELMKKIEAA